MRGDFIVAFNFLIRTQERKVTCSPNSRFQTGWGTLLGGRKAHTSRVARWFQQKTKKKQKKGARKIFVEGKKPTKQKNPTRNNFVEQNPVVTPLISQPISPPRLISAGHRGKAENTGHFVCPVFSKFIYRTKSATTGLSGSVLDTWQPYTQV